MEVPWWRIGGRKRRPRGNNRPRRRPKESSPPSLPCLPEDVLHEIFHRLPLKSITRFWSTCKNWNSILSNPQFIHQIINHRLGGNHHLIFFNPNALKLSLYTIGYQNNNHLIHDNQTSITFSPFKNMFDPSKFDNKAMLLGTCNGLVALLIHDHRTYVLCNPLTGEYTTSDIGNCYHNYRCRQFQVGLCYDASCEEYIVVIVVKYTACPILDRIRAWLVSFKHGIWRMLGKVAQKQQLDFVEGVGKVVCGNAHWIYQGIKIIYLDVKEKRFNHMNLPDFDGDDRIMGLAAMDGEHQLGVVLDLMNSSCLDVWVMKEYGNSESWTHLFKIKIPKLNDKVLCLDVLGFTSSRELLIDMGMKGLWVCDLQQQGNLRQVQSCSEINFSKTYLATYKPSITSVLYRKDGKHRERKCKQLEAEIEEPTTKKKKKQEKEEEEEELEYNSINKMMN